MRIPAKLERYEGNPILRGTGDLSKWDGKGAYNAGAIMYDGKVYILYRGEGLRPRTPGSEFWFGTMGLAISSDGYTIDERADTPLIDTTGESPMLVNIGGVEDPRITEIDGVYYIVYAVSSACFDRLALATTRDFKTVEKHGIIAGDMSGRTGALFPEKINGKYVLMHRTLPCIWLSESSDLKHWENARMIIKNDVLPWTKFKLGVCGVPIRTKNAWAVIFHGKDLNQTYHLGIFWLDLEDPGKVLYIQPEPILSPEMDYETKEGITGNCVYSCGHVIKDDRLIVYYGAADSTLCAASMPVSMLELPEDR